MAGTLARDAYFLSSGSPLEDLCRRLVSAGRASEDQSSLDAAELPLRVLLDHLPDFIYVKDRLSRYVFANRAAIKNVGMASDAMIVGMRDTELFDAETGDRVFAIEQQLMASGDPAGVLDESFWLANGRSQWLLTSKFPLRDQTGEVIGLIGISRDVTERRKQDDLRRGHARLLDMIARGKPLNDVLEALVRLVETELDDVQASVFLMNDTRTRLVNAASPSLPAAYIRLVDGFPIGPRKGCCGTAAFRREPVVVCDVLASPLWEEYRELALTFGFRSCWSTPILDPDGQVLGTFALYGKSTRAPHDREMELTVMATDIAGIAIERARNEERVRHMAHHDPLTGLPNRALFWTQFGRVLSQAQREKRQVTVAYIDLDNFKQINDTLGHAAGDAVLKTLAARMAVSVRASDLLVRLGGDEFAIVFNNPEQNEQGILKRLEHVREAIGAPISIDETSLSATCSMGVAFYPKDGQTAEDLLASADRAMYEAKALGRDALRLSDATER